MNKKIFMAFVMIFTIPVVALAATDGTYNITVDNIGFAGGEESNDGSYSMTDTIGEPVVGIGSSVDYQTQSGFWYEVNNTISMTLDSDTQDLGLLTPGSPITGTTVATVTTDAMGGYDLLIHQNHDLTHTVDGTTTISGFSPGTIATPALWGTGKGLGFSVVSGSGVDAKWSESSNPKYANIPNTSTRIHDKVGYTSGGDPTTIEYKIDVDSTQKSGAYNNLVTYTAITHL